MFKSKANREKNEEKEKDFCHREHEGTEGKESEE